MLTLGGMIGTEAERRQINGSQLPDTRFIRQKLDLPPFEIIIPRLTRKERLYMDYAMPCNDGWKPAAFELSAEAVNAYREVYCSAPLLSSDRELSAVAGVMLLFDLTRCPIAEC